MARKKVRTNEESDIDDAAAPANNMEAKVEKTAPKASPFLEKLVNANRRKFGDSSVVVGTETRVVGVEPYSLALQYLLDLQVIPLQSIISLAGEPKTYKTSLMLEIVKQFMAVGGLGIVHNTEGKWSDSKARSMMGDAGDLLQVVPCATLETWQESASSYLKSIKEACVNRKEAIAKKGRGDKELADMIIPPCAIGIDSLTGAQSTYLNEKIEKDGFASKTYQDRALLNWQWFNVWGPQLVGVPVTIVVVQHLKDKIDNMAAMPVKVTSGGTSVGFMCSVEIRVKNVGAIDKAAYEGAYLQLQTHLNSLGRDKRRIKVPYIEGYHADDTQMAYFDWDEALVLLILELQENVIMRERLSAVLGGPIVEYPKPGSGKVYTCQALGIDRSKAIEEGVSAAVLGKLLQSANPELRKALQAAMRIQPAVVWNETMVL